jgi:crotonobetainyl-CoA:carnitine CoA-transferase CaiB-like acyl-CoA transferase
VLDHPTQGLVRVARPPTKFASTPADIRRPVPLLGEHTAELLREVEFSDAEIEGMVAAKATHLG